MHVTDPVCGMKLDSAKAAATEATQGQTLYFCSSDCHKKFRANPGQYVKSPQKSGQGHGARGC